MPIQKWRTIDGVWKIQKRWVIIWPNMGTGSIPRHCKGRRRGRLARTCITKRLFKEPDISAKPCTRYPQQRNFETRILRSSSAQTDFRRFENLLRCGFVERLNQSVNVLVYLYLYRRILTYAYFFRREMSAKYDFTIIEHIVELRPLSLDNKSMFTVMLFSGIVIKQRAMKMHKPLHKIKPYSNSFITPSRQIASINQTLKIKQHWDGNAYLINVQYEHRNTFMDFHTNKFEV